MREQEGGEARANRRPGAREDCDRERAQSGLRPDGVVDFDGPDRGAVGSPEGAGA